MATISVKPSANRIEFSGNVVNDATFFPTKNGEGANFRIAHNQGRDKKAIFMDVVMFGSDKRALPKDILTKGRYIKVTGAFFEDENTGRDGKTYTNRGIRAYEAVEVKSVVMELSADGKTATAIVDDMPAD